MITGKEIAQTFLECKDKRTAIQELMKVLVEWDEELAQLESEVRSLAITNSNLARLEKQYKDAQLSFPGMEPPEVSGNSQQVPPEELRRRHGGKPDTQVIEEIFREHGPLHVFDLVPIAQERGVPFHGNKEPAQMARDKMYSCKRFFLFGNNVWGLPDQELPEKYNHRGRGNRPLNTLEYTGVNVKDVQAIA